jgi:hypothetical protein
MHVLSPIGKKSQLSQDTSSEESFELRLKHETVIEEPPEFE